MLPRCSTRMQDTRGPATWRSPGCSGDCIFAAMHGASGRHCPLSHISLGMIDSTVHSGTLACPSAAHCFGGPCTVQEVLATCVVQKVHHLHQSNCPECPADSCILPGYRSTTLPAPVSDPQRGSAQLLVAGHPRLLGPFSCDEAGSCLSIAEEMLRPSRRQRMTDPMAARMLPRKWHGNQDSLASRSRTGCAGRSGDSRWACR
mmetsp:Transcript_81923/g.231894  ORF Transcript_81923/g.231894 Transcript_81923/m.231894 type:complete len:203 (-) Transcript_81923:193-801(-)